MTAPQLYSSLYLFFRHVCSNSCNKSNPNCWNFSTTKGGGDHNIILIVIIKAYITISSDCKVLNLGILENFSDLKEIGGFKILELDKSFPYKRVFNKNHGKPLSTNQAG